MTEYLTLLVSCLVLMSTVAAFLFSVGWLISLIREDRARTRDKTAGGRPPT